MILTDSYTDSPCGTILQLPHSKIMFEGICRTNGTRYITLLTHYQVSNGVVSNCKYDSTYVNSKLDEIWNNPMSSAINFIDNELYSGSFHIATTII